MDFLKVHYQNLHFPEEINFDKESKHTKYFSAGKRFNFRNRSWRAQ